MNHRPAESRFDLDQDLNDRFGLTSITHLTSIRRCAGAGYISNRVWKSIEPLPIILVAPGAELHRGRPFDKWWQARDQRRCGGAVHPLVSPTAEWRLPLSAV
jgi:hypothetical protein